jgi:hypothetical protein
MSRSPHIPTVKLDTLLQLAELLLVGEIIEAELVDETEGHARMLEHMLERQIVDVVVGAVDMGV